MGRLTIDFGIDLGTTNSSVALLQGIQAKVFKNNEGIECTPSAVWIDARGRIETGRTAKQRLDSDNENAVSEFKLLMGSQQVYRFAASHKEMRPEDLSAEILKSLRNDVQRSTGEDVVAAAISVPAAFELDQCDATRRAAQLAGLQTSPLVQEPVAAAIACGFQSGSDHVYWMVYDFGGGTFDVAVIHVLDGQIVVYNHGGDNHLGGKLMDLEIVDRLLVPALTREYALQDFRRGNSRWRMAFARLKWHAEEAKIKLSQTAETSILIDPLCPDEQGGLVRFEYVLKRSDIEPLLEPLVERSINRCKIVLEQKRLTPGDIEKVILVGGPTMTPLLRQMLTTRLNIPLEFTVDPLTVNAQGAAIFAGTQKMPRAIVARGRPLIAGQYEVELEWEPIGNEPEPLIGGKVVDPRGEPLTGFSIEFVQAKTQWRSGLIGLSSDGKFITNLFASERSNDFLIELRDSTGNLRPVTPDRFSYTLGIVEANQPLINSMGVALSNNEMVVFLTKGTPLPSRHREILFASTALKKGASGTALRIPVVEGDNTKRADRNPYIGALEIMADQIQRDIPLGSEVEVTLEIDASRIATAKAYVPVLDEVFDHVLDLNRPESDPRKLAEEYEIEKARFRTIREQARGAGDARANELLLRIDREHTTQDIDAALEAAATELEAARRARKRLLDFETALDEAEERLKWPTLVAEAQEALSSCREVSDEYGNSEDRNEFRTLESEVHASMAARDSDLLNEKLARLRDMEWRIRFDQPETWVALLEHLEGRKSEMSDRALAAQLIAVGRRAIDGNDIDRLKTVARQLFALLPEPPPPWVSERYRSGVARR